MPRGVIRRSSAGRTADNYARALASGKPLPVGGMITTGENDTWGFTADDYRKMVAGHRVYFHQPVMRLPVTGTRGSPLQYVPASYVETAASQLFFGGIRNPDALLAELAARRRAANRNVLGLPNPLTLAAIIGAAIAANAAVSALSTAPATSLSVADTHAAMLNAAGITASSGNVAADTALASAVQTGALTPAAANAYASSIASGAVSANSVMTGLASTYGIGGTASSSLLSIAKDVPTNISNTALPSSTPPMTPSAPVNITPAAQAIPPSMTSSSSLTKSIIDQALSISPTEAIKAATALGTGVLSVESALSQQKQAGLAPPPVATGAPSALDNLHKTGTTSPLIWLALAAALLLT